MKRGLVIFFSLLFANVFAQIKVTVDKIIHNAKIYTVNEKFETAQAMAVLNGKVVGIGNELEIMAKFRSNDTENLHGKTVYPGFIDAHSHFTGFAMDKWKAELVGTKSWDEVLEKLVQYSKNSPMQWIYGRSWDQNDWPVKEFPNKEKLDQLFPDRPVYLKRIDGHAAIANQKALDIAGITAETKVDGGETEVKDSLLTGILIDNAMLLVEKHLPEVSDELALIYIESLQRECFSLGLTSVHDAGISQKIFSLLDKAQQKKILKMKIFALMEDNPDTYDEWISKGRHKRGLVTFGGYKVYSDGALGSRGACLLHDYSDKAGWKGFLLNKPEHFKELAARLAKSNLQMATHAIGDSANRVILNIYADALSGQTDRRWRIEHAQIVDRADIGLFGKYKIVPSVQPTHATSDMYWAEERLGKDRIKTAYAFSDLLKQNGWLPLGTDFPVEEISPFKTFLAAVARKDAQNFPKDGFQKENALTREETLRGMTIWAAKSAFEENEKGSLEVSKAADFIILSHDLMTVPEDKILQTEVLETYSQGEMVYQHPLWKTQKKEASAATK